VNDNAIAFTFRRSDWMAVVPNVTNSAQNGQKSDWPLAISC
jgi:hypothetical protein